MAETAKKTNNLGAADLKKIDRLIEQGLYASRTEFARAGIRSQLDKHENSLQEAANPKNTVLGILLYDKSDLSKNQKQDTILDRSQPCGWYIEYRRK